MKGIDHIMISASAGSGKTYQLVRRYLHLLALGVDPKRIAAMTFTRKAAGEFFNRILRRLVDLASGTCDPAEYFEGIDPQPARWPDFTGLMRVILRNMHRLRLGTLDSFFANVTACFPLELGVPVGTSVMAEEETRRALGDTLGALLDRIYRDDSSPEAAVLLEGYKLGTFGREEKSVLRSLEEWIKGGHQLWLDCPTIELWGNPQAIWPKDKNPDALVWQPLAEWPKLAAGIRPLSEGQNWSDDGLAKWNHLVARIENHQAGAKIEGELEELLKKCRAGWADLANGSAEFPWARRKSKFGGPAAQALIQLVTNLAAAEYLCRCERTRGIANVIAAYEKEYDRQVRMQGRLSFADVQRLLAEAGGSGLISESGDGRESLWYRLDSHYDHWLFDEFQDTSVVQWRVVSELVDEVLQDTSGRRSFFAVGDTKQSLYVWRRAEPGLFRAVESRYGGKHGHLKKKFLAKSYRSCQQVLDAVNRVFEDSAELETLLPGCASNWDFVKHEAANSELKGRAALLWCDSEAAGDHDPKFELVAAILNHIQPIERGLSCAVLVRRNSVATELADHLRSATGFDVVSESQQHPATDNPVTLALLSVLKLAAHPGDTFAREHVRMTPLGRIWEQDFGGDLDNMTKHALAVVHERGFAGIAEEWMDRLRSPDFALDAFSVGRLLRLIEIGSEFDETGDRDVDAFIEFASDFGERQQGPESSIQVMTIHKAKGLEFDVVILPDLDGDALNSVRALGLTQSRRLFGETEWILQMPRDVLAGLDLKLRELKEQVVTREGFEGLCELYVAMTRAKLGLYMITKPPPGSRPGTMNAARVLRERLATDASRTIEFYGVQAECVYEIGDRCWFERHAVKPEKTPPAATARTEPLGALLRRLQPVPRRITPSGEETFRIPGSLLFSPKREAARKLGLLVHQLLAEIEWLDGDALSRLPAVWKARGLDHAPGFAEASQQVLALLRDDGVRAVFVRPSDAARVWRERAFDFIDDGNWVSGIIDRVIVNPEGSRRPAWLIDFKTDEVEDDEVLTEKTRGYEPQITQYRRALAALTGSNTAEIRASLVFTSAGKIVDL